MSEEALQHLYEFIVEVVALGIIIWVIWRYVRPPIRQIIAKQQDTVQKQVESAQAASVRLAEAEKKYQEAIAEARTEAAKIRDTARADAQRIVEEMRETADREVVRIRQRGQDDLEAMRLQVLRELRLRVGELTVITATELVHQQLSDDRRRASTVDRLLDELEAMSAQETPVGSDA
jgi:F-type H+-transporting ATPase subunit b